MYVKYKHTGKLEVNDSDFHATMYRDRREYQEISLSRSNALTDCIRKALRAMDVRDEVENVFSQRADLSDFWLSCYLNLGGNIPSEAWAEVLFSFFPSTGDQTPVEGQVIVENLGSVDHLREVDLPTLGLEVAERLVNRTLLKSTIEGESILVVTSEGDGGNLIYGEREVKRMCSLGFETIKYKKETLTDGKDIAVERREFYSWVDVVGS